MIQCRASARAVDWHRAIPTETRPIQPHLPSGPRCPPKDVQASSEVKLKQERRKEGRWVFSMYLTIQLVCAACECEWPADASRLPAGPCYCVFYLSMQGQRGRRPRIAGMSVYGCPSPQSLSLFDGRFWEKTQHAIAPSLPAPAASTGVSAKLANERRAAGHRPRRRNPLFVSQLVCYDLREHCSRRTLQSTGREVPRTTDSGRSYGKAMPSHLALSGSSLLAFHFRPAPALAVSSAPP